MTRMWRWSRPSDEDVRRHLDRQRGLPFSYDAVGRTRTGQAPAGFDLDHNRERLGAGAAAFAAAREAIRDWKMFPPPLAWAEPPGVPIAAGEVVALVAHALGLWWLNASRIVYVIDEPRRFGFAYGTLPGHVERGEERFSVEWLEDGTVWYDLLAFSRPRYWGARLAKPIARLLQRRFVRLSKARMRNAVALRPPATREARAGQPIDAR